MSTNPFDDDRPFGRGGPRVGRRSTRGSSDLYHPSTNVTAASTSEPDIWAARNVEWPLPNSLSLTNYLKLVKASKVAGQQLGITTSHPSTEGSQAGASTVGVSGTASSAGDNASDVGGSSNVGDSNYYGLSGFMSRVLNTSGASEKSTEHLASDDLLHDLSVSERAAGDGRPLYPPRPGCVASANGWIVAVLECPPPTTLTNTNTAGSTKSSGGGTSSASTIPTTLLRLVSRWNVRRGGMADQWLALPPPVRGDGKILHVFVDPTASHTLISAANGEAYYIHSSQQKQSIKLAGFGYGVDGFSPPSKELTGIPASAVAHRRDEASQAAIQSGVTLGTYVTAVAWDKERGTEGSTKKILLGTSGGEIYEYSLVSPNSDDQEDLKNSKNMPVLLHKLYTDSGDPTETGAVVSGLYFERLRTGLLVIAATSGRHKRTRFYTFYSAHSSSFKMVMADQQHASLSELPGSVDFADLRLCNDNFGLRTATGIYYGRIDRSLSGQSVSGGGSMVADPGILPYESDMRNSRGTLPPIPVSLVVTPHHFITLSESDEVRFINQVARKSIQTERIDIGNHNHMDVSAGELLMDVRRPDQVWLRKGRSLVHISSSQEDRDVWKFTLKKCLSMTIKNRSPSVSPTGRAEIRWGTTSDRLMLTTSPGLTDEEKAQEALFDQAKNLCTNAAQKAVVTYTRAEYHLSQGRAELAAKYLAQSPPVLAPFADTSIRLALPKLGIDDPSSYGGSAEARASLEASNIPLIAYLSDKMRVGTMNDDKMTSTMIGAWLTELYLHERGEHLGAPSAGGEIDSTQRAMLARFLNSNVNNMDAKTIMKILTSHDVGAGECAIYAARSGDIATAVNAALSVGSDDSVGFLLRSLVLWSFRTRTTNQLFRHCYKQSGAFEALQILNDAPFELAESLYYKHAPVLLARAPVAAGESFLRRFAQGLSPMRLLPSIMHYEQNRLEKARLGTVDSSSPRLAASSVSKSKLSLGIKVDGAVNSPDGFELQVKSASSDRSSFVDESGVSTAYLEGVIEQGCRSSAVYSYLVSLYVKLDSEEPLLAFLTSHVPATTATTQASKKAMIAGAGAQHELSSPLDMSYALRTVLSSGRHFRSAIKLYMGLGMREQAVELALRVDPSLARTLAQDSVDLDERKRLWLMIAKNAASDGSTLGGKDVVSRVVSVLKDCGPEVLSIEDVLPFLYVSAPSGPEKANKIYSF